MENKGGKEKKSSKNSTPWLNFILPPLVAIVMAKVTNPIKDEVIVITKQIAKNYSSGFVTRGQDKQFRIYVNEGKINREIWTKKNNVWKRVSVNNFKFKYGWVEDHFKIPDVKK